MVAEPKSGNPGFNAGIAKRTNVERLAWAWKGAEKKAVERRLTPVQAVTEARNEINKLNAKLRKAEQDRKKADVTAALIFAHKDNVGKLAKYEFFSPCDASADARDLEIMRDNLMHTPIGLVVVVLDREKKRLIVHARPWILQPPALKLLEEMVAKAKGEDLKEDWWTN
jgi:hypothetical protein